MQTSIIYKKQLSDYSKSCELLLYFHEQWILTTVDSVEAAVRKAAVEPDRKEPAVEPVHKAAVADRKEPAVEPVRKAAVADHKEPEDL